MARELTIGEVQEVNINIYKGKDFGFDLRLWEDDAKTEPSIVDAARGQVRTTWDGDLLLDLAPHIVIAGNVVQVVVPAAATAALPARDRCVWDFEWDEPGGTDKIRGTARIYPEASK